MMRRRVKYVSKRKYKKRSEPVSYRPVAMLVVALVIFLMVQLLTLSIVGTKGAELADLQENKKKAEEHVRLLKAQIANAMSLERIEYIATKKLGMEKVQDVKYFGEGGYVSTANVGDLE